MGKRGGKTKRQEGERKNGGRVQKQETMAPSLGFERVTRMRMAPKLEHTQEFVHLKYQTRNDGKILDHCKAMPATPMRAVRHVEKLHHSPPVSSLPEVVENNAPEMATGTVRTELDSQPVLTDRSVLATETQKVGKHRRTVPNSLPEVVENNEQVMITCQKEQNNATASKANVALNPSKNRTMQQQTRSYQSGVCPMQSGSLTRVAALMSKYDSDDDEVRSGPDNLWVTVKGYSVKAEAAPVLEKIFLKYGDIAKYCSLPSVKVRSALLECVCDLYKELEATNFRSIAEDGLETMQDGLADLVASKIDVEWLRERLDDISQAKVVALKSCTLKEAKTRNLEQIEKKQKIVDELNEELIARIKECKALQESIRKEKEELDAAKRENESVIKRFEDSKFTFKGFLQNSLVHDLL